MRFAFTFVVMVFTGCSTPPAETAQTKSDLMLIVLQYHEYVDQHQVPPTNIDELVGFERESPFGLLPGNQAAALQSRCTTALRSGDYVVIWSYNVAEDLGRNGTVILAYHKNVPTNGGYVAFADGNAVLLNKEQFTETAKAEPTTASQSD